MARRPHKSKLERVLDRQPNDVRRKYVAALLIGPPRHVELLGVSRLTDVIATSPSPSQPRAEAAE